MLTHMASITPTAEVYTVTVDDFDGAIAHL